MVRILEVYRADYFSILGVFFCGFGEVGSSGGMGSKPSVEAHELAPGERY